MSAGPDQSAESVDEAASTLQQLIQTCKEGETSFLSAAGAVTDLNLRRLFESYSQQRAEFAAELELEVCRLAARQAEEGPVAAAPPPSWMETKPGPPADRDEGAIISGCEQGDETAVRSYEQALDSSLPPHLRLMVERQFLHLKQAHDQIRSLERTHSRHS